MLHKLENEYRLISLYNVHYSLFCRIMSGALNVAIYLVETFIEQERFQGTCYKASNWKHVGQTRGYAKTKKAYRCHGIIKDIYVYPTISNSLELLQCL